jgi:hypothetical protein
MNESHVDTLRRWRDDLDEAISGLEPDESALQALLAELEQAYLDAPPEGGARMNVAQGKGRKPSPDQARKASERAFDAAMDAACRDSGRARPKWMQDRSKLSRKPPGGRP